MVIIFYFRPERVLDNRAEQPAVARSVQAHHLTGGNDNRGLPAICIGGEKKKKGSKSHRKAEKGEIRAVTGYHRRPPAEPDWWGIAWNSNLERYSDYSNRIGRGRSYVRNGAVLDLQIEPGVVNALVQGSAHDKFPLYLQNSTISSEPP